jgi:hypothetical protein
MAGEARFRQRSNGLLVEPAQPVRLGRVPGGAVDEADHV